MKIDLKKELSGYAARRGVFDDVDIPRRRYAMIRTVETTTGDRLRGIANAASLLLHAKSEPKENLANSAD